LRFEPTWFGTQFVAINQDACMMVCRHMLPKHARAGIRRSVAYLTGMQGALPAARIRFVIFNADDFGASAATNAAAMRAHREGVLTSASLMVAEPGCEDAARLAREHHTLSVGLHLALTDGCAASAIRDIPHLVDADGRFAANPAVGGPRWYFSGACRREIATEIGAQFARFAETGLAMAHVNGHQHAHLHPVVWREMVRRCTEHGVRWVRIPWEEPRGRGTAVPMRRLGEWVFLRAMAKWCRRDAARHGLRYADRVYGHLRTGMMTAEYVARLLGELGGAVNEIYLHPGTPHAQPLAGNEPGMDVDLDALLSDAVRRRIDELDLRRIGYGEE
jgi:chitin disaccharide deacetylase